MLTNGKNPGSKLGKSAPSKGLKEKSAQSNVNWRMGSVPWPWWVSMIQRKSFCLGFVEVRMVLWRNEGWRSGCAGIEKERRRVKGGLRKRGYGVCRVGSDMCD